MISTMPSFRFGHFLYAPARTRSTDRKSNVNGIGTRVFMYYALVAKSGPICVFRPRLLGIAKG